MRYEYFSDIKIGDWVEVEHSDGDIEKAHVIEIDWRSGIPSIILETSKVRYAHKCTLIVPGIKKVDR